MISRKHIFQDLQPYVCTFSDCNEPDKTYATRRAFVNHELQEHRARQSWSCTQPFCNFRSSDRALVGDHQKSHIRSESGIILPNIMVEDQDPAMYGIACPFCKQLINPIKTNLGRHIGKHMEEIAYAAVTKSYEDDDDISSGATFMAAKFSNSTYE